MARRFARAVILGGLLAALVAGAVWLLPRQLGGSTSFVIVSGNSMEPHLSAGDLVIVREQPAYAVGTVAVYEHPDIGQVVHRIIDREPLGFVFKGDNNGFVDGVHLDEEAIRGAEWAVVPGAGRWLRLLQQPAVAGLVVGFALVAFLGGRKAAKRRTWNPSTTPLLRPERSP
ncbi:MAG: signal peptidase I [Dehalococcoidia bacterium]